MPCPSHPPWLDHSNYTWRSILSNLCFKWKMKWFCCFVAFCLYVCFVAVVLCWCWICNLPLAVEFDM
jgi:hypothetical protein